VQSAVITTPAVPNPVLEPTTPVPAVVSTIAAARTTTTQAAVPPITAVFAVLAGAGLILYRATRR